MSDSTRNPGMSATVATVARSNAQVYAYTDCRFAELSARLDTMQVTVRQTRERTETVKARVKFADRITCVIIAACLAVVLDRTTGLPHVAVIGIGTLPECARETFEFLRRL